MGISGEHYRNGKGQVKIMMLIGSLDAGGKERQMIALLKALKDFHQYSTWVAVTRADGLRESEAGRFANRVVRIKRFFKYDLLSPIIRLVYYVKKENIQVIHTWGSGIWDIVGLFVAKICRIPMLHGGIRFSPVKLDFSKHLTKWSAVKADAIIANSHAGLQAFGLANDPRSRVIYNGIDMKRFQGLNELPAHDSNNLCMVANFSNKKDHISLVTALPVILKSFPNVKVTMVGHDAGTLPVVKSYASEIGVEDCIEYITDTLNPESYIAKCRIGILLTNAAVHGEGTANALLEYMALSKPVVVSDNGGNREVVQDGVSGYVIPPGSPDEIAKHVILLLEDEKLAQEMGRAGKASLLKNFDLKNMVNSYINIYKVLIK